MSAATAMVKDEICTLAARRHQCWVKRDTAAAHHLTEELTVLWAKWRGEVTATRAATLAPLHVVPVDNAIDRFLIAACVEDPHVVTPVRIVFDAYRSWGVKEGEDLITPMRLTQELKRRGIETTRTKNARLYRGLAVTAIVESPLTNAA